MRVGHYVTTTRHKHIHRIIDGAYKAFHAKHRRIMHNPETVALFAILGGDDYAAVALLHLIQDGMI